jgi:hypothetical protein
MKNVYFSKSQRPENVSFSLSQLGLTKRDEERMSLFSVMPMKHPVTPDPIL